MRTGLQGGTRLKRHPSCLVFARSHDRSKPRMIDKPRPYHIVRDCKLKHAKEGFPTSTNISAQDVGAHEIRAEILTK